MLLPVRIVTMLMVYIITGLHCIYAYKENYNCQIRTRNGIVRGLDKVTYRNGKHYCSYTRIPYALPPIGRLRFKEPVPMIPWNGILDATSDAEQCPQIDPFIDRFKGDEDCLYANVYTPQVGKNMTDLLPVYVWIFGGAFEYGSADSSFFGPDHLLDENIILVTFNYRLGPFGFLSLGTKDYPGNAGLKDQRLLLCWVQENIQVFGGDKRMVTIGGWSAGAASTVIHILSPSSRGLFRHAIAQSGTSLNPWAVSPVTEARRRAYLLGRAMGVWTRSDKQLLKRLYRASTEEIIAAAKKVTVVDLAFRPTTEPTGTPGSILEECSFDILREGRFPSVPLLLGFNKEEGIYPLAVFNGFTTFARKIEDTALIGGLPGGTVWGNAFSRIRHLLEDTIVEASTSLFFVPGIQQTAKLISRKAPVFLYKFMYNGKGGIHDEVYRTKIHGVAHGDEIPYVFKTILAENYAPNSRDEITSRRLARLWANFVKHGNPVPTQNDELLISWPRYTEQYQDYLEIGDDLRTKNYAANEAASFLENYILGQPKGYCRLSNVIAKLP
ncbi:cholinesterase [Cephus cinctus]|uniref:Carboxylic ester hydrolase n=1 Tax=Cephus cinctus TaxID=211228 RepID=A0AAJ7FJR1_CEPCN|nr:cholinesterase [Cephus cinctus]